LIGQAGCCLVLLALSVYSISIADDLRTRLLSRGAESQMDNSPQPVGSFPDNSINPAEYLIGAGDGFRISVIELPSIFYSATINSDNVLNIADLGILHLGRISLSAARDSIAAFVKTRLKMKSDVYVELSSVKAATITIAGAVAKQGTYILSGKNRVFDAIKEANNGTLACNEVNCREVRVANGQDTVFCDIMKFVLQNDLKENPYLYPGDNILLLAPTRRILIEGALKSPIGGLIPIKKNETADKVLSLFPIEESADSGQIIVKKHGAEEKSQIYSWNDLATVRLEDGDIVVVAKKPDYESFNTVFIGGEISRPGFYPITKGNTVVSELIELAGGYTPYADLEGVFVVRGGDQISNSSAALTAAPAPVPDLSIRPGISAALYRATLTGDFSVINVKPRNDPTLLKNGDHVIIPRMDKYVYISGSVKNPGAIKFGNETNAMYYIRIAGGFSSRADKTNIVIARKRGEKTQFRENPTVQAGDVIVVPEKEMYRNWNLFKDFVIIVGSIAQTALLLISIINLNR
jgi:protein involved in polysaccharide export with SLBB domain